jgi:hypothetical protein
VVDVAEAILPWVIRHDIELFYVKDDPELDKVGNIAALLRFRPAKTPDNVRQAPHHHLRQQRLCLCGGAFAFLKGGGDTLDAAHAW